jgi:hypothetical protein
MPWVWIGGKSFNLSRVELVMRSGDDGVVITLKSGKEVDLAGPEAEAFLRLWDDHTSARVIGGAYPDVLTPMIIRPDSSTDVPSSAGR